MIETLNQMWTNLLGFLNGIIVPDWGSLVDLLPIFLVVGIVGPIITLLVVFWFVYVVSKPRLHVAPADPRRPAPLDELGTPVFPPGEPYSLRERMIYEPGATRSATGDELLVACPKCGLVRRAAIDTCGNCGLSFTIHSPTIAVRPAGPPPGGAAAA